MSTQETPARHRSQILIPLQPFPSTIPPALGRSCLDRPAHVKKVLELAKDGLSYRLIGRNLGLSKNTVIKQHPDLVATGTGELEQKLELPQFSVSCSLERSVDVMDSVN